MAKYSIEGTTLTAVADKLREKTGTAEAITPEEMPEKVDAVFEAGEKSERDRFWDIFQNFGTRESYIYAFSNWGAEYIRPKYKVVPQSQPSLSNTFNGAKNLKRVEKAYFDFSHKPIGTNAQNSCYYTFNGCRAIEVVEDIGIQAEHTYNNTFTNCAALTTIEVLRSHQGTLYSNAFNFCSELANLTIEGAIGQNGFNVRYSTKLTHDSLMSIINALVDYSTDSSGTVWTVTLGTANLAKLTEEEMNIAKAKGWDLA